MKIITVRVAIVSDDAEEIEDFRQACYEGLRSAFYDADYITPLSADTTEATADDIELHRLRNGLDEEPA